MNGNGMTGYNEQEVIEATNGIKTGIENYFAATNSRLENDFVRLDYTEAIKIL